MHSYYKQRIFIFKDQDYTQWLTFYVHVRHLKFHFGILVGDMNHFSQLRTFRISMKSTFLSGIRSSLQCLLRATPFDPVFAILLICDSIC